MCALYFFGNFFRSVIIPVFFVLFGQIKTLISRACSISHTGSYESKI